MRRTILITHRGIEVSITLRSDAKYLRLRVVSKPPHVRVSAPSLVKGEDVLSFIDSNIDTIERAMSELRESEAHKPAPIRHTLEDSARFHRLVRERIGVWSERMGLRVRSVTIRPMTSRWGSCRPNTASITINYKLIDLPAECLDYVVVHELAHLVYPDHSPQFWAGVEKYFPDYRRVRKSLKKYT